MSDQMLKYWEGRHLQNDPVMLTGFHIDEVWTWLNINNYLIPTTIVLNIGVGLGYCTKELWDLGLSVDVLDISHAAIGRVMDCSNNQYLSENIEKLPMNVYDLAVSHLVTQHIDDIELDRQIFYVLQSLKKDGIFAMQFAILPGDNRKMEERQTIIQQRAGGVTRTLSEIRSITERAGGYLHWNSEERVYEHTLIRWQYIHIKKR